MLSKKVALKNNPSKKMATENIEIFDSELFNGFISLRVKKDFLPHQKIFTVQGIIVDFRNERTLQLDENVHINPVNLQGEPTLGYYLNHSCHPNTYSLVIQNPASGLLNLEIFALQSIRKNGEITVDYAFMESEIANPCECECGSHNCRGRIMGFTQLSSQEIGDYVNRNIPLSMHLLKLLPGNTAENVR